MNQRDQDLTDATKRMIQDVQTALENCEEGSTKEHLRSIFRHLEYVSDVVL